jgi:integrase
MNGIAVKIRKIKQLRNHEGRGASELQKLRNVCISRRRIQSTDKANHAALSHKQPVKRFKDIAEAWLESSKLYLKKSSFSTYCTIVSTHLKPYFGDVAIGDISTEHISAFLSEISTSRKLGSEEGLASSTIRGIASILRSILKYAESEGYEIKTLGCVVRRKEHIRETRILNDEEWKRLELCLMRNIDATKLGMLICMYTGIRLGEICALKWGDISVDAGMLTVNRTMQRIKNSTPRPGKTVIIIDAPKSLSSVRSIPVPSFLLEIIKNFETARNCFVLTGDF